jgi:hypothetical protein
MPPVLLLIADVKDLFCCLLDQNPRFLIERRNIYWAFAEGKFIGKVSNGAIEVPSRGI